MGHRARVYLQRPGTQTPIDLGEQDLEMRPIRHGRARFQHKGRTEIGHIETIDPPDWESAGAMPHVLVVQRQ